MGFSISTGYKNNYNYELGQDVKETDKSFEDQHKNQEVEITTAPAPENSQSAAGEMEEFDLSLDSNNSDKSINSFDTSDSSSVDAAATGTAANNNDAAATGTQTGMDSTAADGGNPNAGTTSGTTATGTQNTSGSTSTPSVNTSSSTSTASGANTSTSTSGSPNVNGNPSSQAGGSNTTGGAAGGGEGDGGVSTGAQSAPEPTSAGQIVGVTSTTVSLTIVNKKGELEVSEVPIEEFVNTMRHAGFTETDIQRVLDGQISLPDLYEEIQTEDDPERRNRLLAAGYIQQFGLDFCTLDEMAEAIAEDNAKLAELIASRDNPESHRYELLMTLIYGLETGNKTIDSVVAWEYVGEDGQIHYLYQDPYASGDYDGSVEYTPKTYDEMFPDDPNYQRLKELTAIEGRRLFSGTPYTSYVWSYSDEQIDFMSEMSMKASQERDANDNIQNEIETVYNRIQTNAYIHDWIEGEIEYINNCIDPYTKRADFLENSPNQKIYEQIIQAFKQRVAGSANYYYDPESIPWVPLSGKEEVVAFLMAMVNGDASTSGFILIDGVAYQVTSGDTIFNHYKELIKYLNQDEIDILNYIYNTEGADAVYEYLEAIAPTIDLRAYHQKVAEDTEWARKNPFLASLYSIFITPFEGMAAFAATANTLACEGKIWRIDAYSRGNTYRNAVAGMIAEKSPVLSFIYSTGMSMADSAMLIGIGYLTGGFALPLISAALMGSRAFVATLNEALDRGISDGRAFALAFASGVVETAMETWSAGHLLNLDKVLEKTALNLSAKVAGKISNKTLDKILTKAVYIFTFAVSQGICEGEEEFCTEILNYVADVVIAKDKSNYAAAMQRYISLGFGAEDAFWKTMADFSGQVIEAFLGGFISGICFGVFAGARSSVRVGRAIAADTMNQYNAESDAVNFINALQQNSQEIEQNQTTIKEVTKSKMAGLTNIETINATLKNIASKIMGINTVTAADINIALANKTITAEQANLLLNGTMLDRICTQIKAIQKAMKQLQKANTGTPILASGVKADVGLTYNEIVMEDLRYAIGHNMVRFNCSMLEAFQSIKEGIMKQDYSYFTRDGNARALMQKHSFFAIDIAYHSLYEEFTTRLTTDVETVINSLIERFNYSEAQAIDIINGYINGTYGLNYITSRNGARSIVEHYTTNELLLGLRGYAALQVAIMKVQGVISSYLAAYPDMTPAQVIANIYDYLTTDNLARITRNGGARDTIAQMDKKMVAAALARINNSNMSVAPVVVNVQNQITNVKELLVQIDKVFGKRNGSSFEAISMLKKALINAVTTNDANAIAFAKQVVAVFANNPRLSIVSITPGDCYWSQDRQYVHLGQRAISINNVGTLFHELGHCLFDTVLRTTLPYSLQVNMSRAQQLITNNRSQYERVITKLNQKIAAEARTNFVQNLAAVGTTLEGYKQTLIAKYTQAANMQLALAESLRRSGRSEEYIKKTIKAIVSPTAAAEADIRNQISRIDDQIWRTTYPAYTALSDMVDALFAGRKIDLHGQTIETVYSHSEDYYANSGNSIEYQFHELIADYTNLLLSQDKQALQLFRATFGADFADMMQKTFDQMMGQPIQKGKAAFKVNIHFDSESNTATGETMISDFKLVFENLKTTNPQLLKSIVDELAGNYYNAKSFDYQVEHGFNMSYDDFINKVLLVRDLSSYKEGLSTLLREGQYEAFKHAIKLIGECADYVSTLKNQYPGVNNKSLNVFFNIFNEILFADGSTINIINFANNNYGFAELQQVFKQQCIDYVIGRMRAIDSRQVAVTGKAVYTTLIQQIQAISPFITLESAVDVVINPNVFVNTSVEKGLYQTYNNIRDILIKPIYEAALNIKPGTMVNSNLYQIVAEMERYHYLKMNDFVQYIVENNLLNKSLDYFLVVKDLTTYRKGTIEAVAKKHNIQLTDDVMAALLQSYDFKYSIEFQTQIILEQLVTRQVQLTGAEISEFVHLVSADIGSILNMEDAATNVRDQIKAAKTALVAQVLDAYKDRLTTEQYDTIVANVVQQIGVYASTSTIAEYIMNQVALPIEIKQEMVITSLQKLLGDLMTPEILHNLVVTSDTTFGEVLRGVYEQLLQTHPAIEIIHVMAQNIELPAGMFTNNADIRSSIEAVMIHILCYDPNLNENGGGHYNSALLNAISGRKFQFKDTAGNILDTLQFAKGIIAENSTGPNKSIFPNSYSIQQIIDAGVSAYMYSTVDESNMRLNGNYVFTYQLPAGSFEGVQRVYITLVYDFVNDMVVTIFPVVDP